MPTPTLYNDPVSLQVTGLDEAIQMFQGLPEIVQVYGLMKGLNAAGDILFNAVEAITPIRLDPDSTVASGWSGHGVGGGGLKAAVKKDVVVRTDLTGTVRINHGKLSYVAYFLEYGHQMIGHKPQLKKLEGSRTPGGRVRAYPIMRPVAEQYAQPAVEAFTKSIIETISAYEKSFAATGKVA